MKILRNPGTSKPEEQLTCLTSLVSTGSTVTTSLYLQVEVVVEVVMEVVVVVLVMLVE